MARSPCEFQEHFLKIRLQIFSKTAIRTKSVRERTKTKVTEEEVEPSFSDELEGDDGEGDEEEKAKSVSPLFHLFELTVTCCLISERTSSSPFVRASVS